MTEEDSDVAVIGAGAAGIFAALRARGVLGADGSVLDLDDRAPSVVLLDGSARVGRKILISGGGRCNVTNVEVDERDFVGGAPRVVRSILREFPAAAVRRYFQERGLPLVEEPIGKLFPETQRAGDVLRVLLADVERAQIPLRVGAPVTAVKPTPEAGRRFRIERGDGAVVTCDTVVVATGGKSVPTTGSTGFGYELAVQLGEPLLPPRPALVPLLLRLEGSGLDLAGLTCAAILTVTEPGVRPEQVSGARYHAKSRAGGSLLFTHGGLSGPCALDVSEACAAAVQSGAELALRGDFWTLTRPGSPFPDLRETRRVPGSSLGPRHCPTPVDRATFAHDLEEEVQRGDRSVLAWVADHQPRRLAEFLLHAGQVDPRRRLSEIRGRELERLWHAVVHAVLPFERTDGYQKAEVTAGGVDLRSVDRRTLQSRRVSGLRWCGEVLDATGRLGGFNFQWAWSSGFVAGGGLDRPAP